MLPHCDFQAEYAHVHEVKHYTGIKEVCMYMSEASVVWKYPCLDQWINQLTCTHTHMQVFFSKVYPPDQTWFAGRKKKPYRNEWYTCCMLDSICGQMSMHQLHVTCTLRMLYVICMHKIHLLLGRFSGRPCAYYSGHVRCLFCPWCIPVICM